jgi:hypothetical protein
LIRKLNHCIILFISTPHKNYPSYPDLEAAIEGTTAPTDVIAKLELVPVDFMDFYKRRKVGQLVVACEVAADVQEIFGKIRDARFPIRSIVPIVFFGHDDHSSIAENNTSGFCYRLVDGTDRLSRHALGLAVDVNPLFNPYVNGDGSRREGSFPYPGYDIERPGTIVPGGAVVAAFLDKGWEWGGQWEDPDYQHFNRPQ